MIFVKLIGLFALFSYTGIGAQSSREPESICGREMEFQDVNDYDGSLGVSVDFVEKHKSYTGVISSSRNPENSSYCTGVLIQENLFLTAGHCVSSGSTQHFVVFNWELWSDYKEEAFRIVEIVEDNDQVDYAILRLEGTPGLSFGTARLSYDQARIGEQVTIVQHPQGEPKKVEVGPVIGSDGEVIRYHQLDTMSGSSGSGILGESGYLVGVHTTGGCTPYGGNNSGVAIQAIRRASKVIN